jgi:hypothetical protein
MKLVAILVACVMFGFFASSVSCLGPSISKHTAVWDANAEEDLAGYYLYWKTPGGAFSDANRVTVPVASNPSYDLMQLSLPSGNYIIAVSAFDNEGNESALSEEVTWDASYPAAPKVPKIQ